VESFGLKWCKSATMYKVLNESVMSERLPTSQSCRHSPVYPGFSASVAHLGRIWRRRVRSSCWPARRSLVMAFIVAYFPVPPCSFQKRFFSENHWRFEQASASLSSCHSLDEPGPAPSRRGSARNMQHRPTLFISFQRTLYITHTGIVVSPSMK